MQQDLLLWLVLLLNNIVDNVKVVCFHEEVIARSCILWCIFCCLKTLCIIDMGGFTTNNYGINEDDTYIVTETNYYDIIGIFQKENAYWRTSKVECCSFNIVITYHYFLTFYWSYMEVFKTLIFLNCWASMQAKHEIQLPHGVYVIRNTDKDKYLGIIMSCGLKFSNRLLLCKK